MTDNTPSPAGLTIPETHLDSRFSDPRAEAATWEQTLEVLDRAQIFWLTTVRADGRPHVTPLAGAWGFGAAHFHTGTNEQKWLNLQHNQNVVMTTGCNDWQSGLDVIIEGKAVHITDEAELSRLAPLWTDKWDGRWKLEARDNGFFNVNFEIHSQVFSVVPTRVFAHKKGDPFGATTHRFDRA